MEFLGSYSWYEQFPDARHRFMPVRVTKDVDDSLFNNARRSTLRMRWRVAVDHNRKICLRALWDARRQSGAK